MRALLLLSAVAAGSAAAQEKEKGQDKAKPADVRVLAIRATTRDKEVSPQLKELAEKLKRQFNYTGFRLERQEKKERLEVGRSFEAELIGDYRARVKLKENDGKRVELQIEVHRSKDKDQDKPRSTTVRVPVGEAQLFGGMALDGGDVLIVAVSAR